MRRLVALFTLVAAFPSTGLGQAGATSQTSGRLSTGTQQFDNNTGSSKFSEYRDLRDDIPLLGFGFDLWGARGSFLEVTGTNVTRRDRSLGLRTGKAGTWRFDLGWNEIPHLLSNKAQSPYVAEAPGRLEVAAPIAIPFKRLNTTAANAPSVLASDSVIAAYALANVRPIRLGTQTNTGTVGLRYTGGRTLDLSVDYTRRTKTGSRVSYGPIGDRPPRTLNVELAEPVDYRTGDLRLAAGLDGGRYQARVEYLFSSFANQVDQLVWENMYATPASRADYDTWDRLIGTYGRRPLPPDNQYHQATASAGANLPLDSRLGVSFSYGRMIQDQALVPYAYHWDTLATGSLPRGAAAARMNTTNITADYSIAPARGVSLRGFYRRFELQNETPASQWWYATQDASNTNGTVSYKNKRVSVPYAWDRQTAGGDATVRLGFWRSSVGLGFEREDIGRAYREAGTGENRFRASWRARPVDWLSLRARYLRGDRDGGSYDWRVTSQTYWYAAADAGADNDNPQFTFSDHPDMRRYDVADRLRDQVDVTLGLAPRAAFSISTTFRYQRDDFDSDVQAVQPLLGRPLADSLAATPGDQLGLLRSERRQVSVDLVFEPTDQLSLNASGGWDRGEARQRSLEFNENNKQNPSAVGTAELGPWTRAESQWTADFDDRTWYLGAGGTLGIVPEKLTLTANYTASLSQTDIAYSGFGLTNWDGTEFPANHQFAFQEHGPVRQESHVADVRLQLPVVRDITMVVGYTYDYYKVDDFQQAESDSCHESVAGEFLLRDTSRSHQWGNRLFNLGRYLAPGYTAHLAYVSLAYRF